MLASTPQPPYYAVIFTSTQSNNLDGYEATAQRMVDLAQEQPGFLGIDSARSDIGISVSYWNSLNAIHAWKNNAEHTIAREQGRKEWYKNFQIRIAKVETQYGM